MRSLRDAHARLVRQQLSCRCAASRRVVVVVDGGDRAQNEEMSELRFDGRVAVVTGAGGGELPIVHT